MREMLSKTKSYSIVILKATPKRKEAGADSIVWEHGRRNFLLPGRRRALNRLPDHRQLCGERIVSLQRRH